MIKRHYDYVLENVSFTLERFVDENKRKFHQFLHFLMVDYLIIPDFITFYGKKNFEILTNFTRKRFLRPSCKITREIAKFCNFAII